MTMTITDALNDLRDRATQERDGIAFATIVEVQRALPNATAGAEVPDVSGQAPFRASDPEALKPDGRGLNRSS